MSFLAPFALGFLGLLVPLTLLYILKRRRTEKVVGSSLLWQAAMRDLRAERPWKRLVPYVALIIQALIIVAGAIALSRPVGAGSIPSGSQIAVVLDVSASMTAIDAQGVSRLERAKTLLENTASNLSSGSQMVVITAGEVPSVMTPLTSDPETVRSSLSQISAGASELDLNAAVALAADRLRNGGAKDGSHVLVITDGAVEDVLSLIRLTTKDGVNIGVKVAKVGEEASNTAIVDAGIRAKNDGTDRADVFVRIAQYGKLDAEVRVTASTETGKLLTARRVSVEAGKQVAVLMPTVLPPNESGVAPLVSISISSDTPDALALDNQAVLPSPLREKLPVYLVGGVPTAVTRALRADDRLELYATNLKKLAELPDGEALRGLFVYAGDQVPKTAPSGDSLVIAPTSDKVFEANLGATQKQPQVISWDESDLRMRFVSLRDVHLIDGRSIDGPGVTPLVNSNVGALLASVTRPNGQSTILGFDPGKTDWPAQPSFVVFLRNLIEGARARRAEGGIPAGRLGEPLRIPAPDDANVSVIAPSGLTTQPQPRQGLALQATNETGVYQVNVETAEGSRTLFGLRNLLSGSESNLADRLKTEDSAKMPDQEKTAQSESPAQHAESWPYLALLLMLLLAADVWWLTRREAV